MLSSISPVGEAARHQRWPITVSAYLLGSAAGGAVIGTSLGVVAGLIGVDAVPQQWRLAILAVAALFGGGLDAGVIPVALPSWRRQVDERWLSTYRGWVYGLGYGAQLGFGVVTIVTSSLTYVALLAALLTGRASSGLLVGVTFGLLRALPLVLIGRVGTAARLRRFHASFAALARPANTAGVAYQIVVAVVAAGLAVGPTVLASGG